MGLTVSYHPGLPSTSPPPPTNTSVSPQVNVTVGAESTGLDTQVTTAAALAESARQLAQSAAEFGEESDNVSVETMLTTSFSDASSCWTLLVWYSHFRLSCPVGT